MSEIIEFADKLRTQIDIVDVVGKYVQLRQFGTNQKGLCPFHKEKTPSFSVSSAKQIFHCFGCHEGGDVIKFVQKIERLEWIEAVRHLAGEYGFPMPELRQRTPADEQAKDSKTAALSAAEYAVNLFTAQLHSQLSNSSEIATYLQSRKISPEVAKQFQLGLAPSGWSGLMDSAQKKGHTRDSLIDAGLIIHNAAKDRYYDRFRNRLIFPIHDAHGKPVAFGARVFASTAAPDEPKYINSPECLIYHKGQALYAMHLAKDSIVQKRQAVLMEGYMDVLRAHANGVTNAIASCGTALTDEQARTLKRFAAEVVFAYDGDAAGQKAMLRGTEILLQHGFTVRIITLPSTHDPDSYIAEHGGEAFAQLVSSARGFFAHFCDYASSCFDMKQPEGKVQAVEMMLPLLRRITQPIIRREYVVRLADRLQVEPALIDRQLSSANPASFDKLKSQIFQPDSSSGVVEKTLLKLLVECPVARQRIRTKVKPNWLKDQTVKRWFLNCCELQDDEITWENLLHKCELESAEEAALLRELAIQEQSCDSSERTIEHVASRLHRNYLREQNLLLAREIDEFFNQGQQDNVLDQHLQKADSHATPLRELTGKYMLKPNLPGRRH